MAFHVQARERVVFFQNLDLARARHVEHLVVGVVAVFQRFERLAVYGLVGHHPQHQSFVALQKTVEHLAHAGGGQQRLATTRGHLQANVGDGAARAVPAARMRQGSKGRRQRARLAQRIPGVARVVGRSAQRILHALHGLELRRSGHEVIGLLFARAQLGDKGIELLQRLVLKLLQVGGAQRARQRHRAAPGLPEQLAVALDLRHKLWRAHTLPVHHVQRVHDGQVFHALLYAQEVLGTPARRIQSQVEVGAGTPVVAGTRAKYPHPLQALGGIKKTPQGLQRAGLQTKGTLAGRRGRLDRAAHAERSRSVTSSASNRRTASWRTNAATCMASASS